MSSDAPITYPYELRQVKMRGWEIVNLTGHDVKVTACMTRPPPRKQTLTFEFHLKHAEAQIINDGHIYTYGIVVTVVKTDDPSDVLISNFPIDEGNIFTMRGPGCLHVDWSTNEIQPM